MDRSLIPARMAVVAALALGLVACADDSPLAPIPRFALSDGAHGGNAHFYFLPPLVRPPAYTGTFDPTQSPVVRIMLGQGVIASLQARLDFGGGLYFANLHTRELGLAPGRTYRISVVVGTQELGFADIELVGSGRELRNVTTGEYIRLIGGQTLPVTFRIEVGAVTKPVGSLVFDGIQHFAETPSAADLNFTGDYTLEAWFNPVRYAGNMHLVSKWGAFPNASYTLQTGGATVPDVPVYPGSAFWPTTGGAYGVLATTPVTIGVWQHVAAVHSHDSLLLYVDGALVAVATGLLSVNPSSAVVRLGRASGMNCGSETWCESYLAGALSDVRLWNTARSAAQIAASRFSRLTGSEAGLVAYWRLDDGSGDIAHDFTGRGHDVRLGAAAGPDAADPVWSATNGPPITP